MDLRKVRNVTDFILQAFGSSSAEDVPFPRADPPGVSDLATAKKILIIDDDLGIMPLLAYGLKQSGYGVFGGRNGLEALELAARLMPDLILIDVELPGISGAEAARMLKKDEELKHIPVILMSSGHEKTGEGPEACCADAYISKPFRFDDVCGMVKKYCAPVSQPVFASYGSF